MGTRERGGGLSILGYVAVALLGAIAFALRGPTDGRSFGLLAPAGAIAIIDGLRYFRATSTPKTPDEMDAPLTALAVIAAGIAFLVLGVLAAVGVVRID